MNKYNEILINEEYRAYLKTLEALEKNREFCNHTLEHFLDVARIAYIMVLEENINISKDIIYAIALLHDMGRVLEYEKGIPHHEGSIIIAEEILRNTTYLEEEKFIIYKAIGNHRKEAEDILQKIIYKSDKLSRNCFNCKVEEKCYWSREKKNFTITY